jgi:flagellar protein FlbD
LPARLPITSVEQAFMIAVTRLDGAHIMLNDEQIESIEQTPDTLVSLVNGHKLLVRDAPADLVQRVIAFRQTIAAGTRPSAEQPFVVDPAAGTPR